MKAVGRVVAIALGAAAIAGCGGGEPTTTTTTARETSGQERPRERDDGAQITGLMGTISQQAVRDTMEPRMDSFLHCFERRMADVEFLGGEVRMSFRIHEDGSVAWVYPSESTLGDIESERCVLDIARRAHFPRPRGGEAEFSWGFGFDPPPDVRAPVAWDASRVEAVVQTAGLASRCGRGGIRVTAYVQPGGQVLAAGASTPDADALAALDCVIDGVRGLAMPDPGSYAAKVSFDI